MMDAGFLPSRTPTLASWTKRNRRPAPPDLQPCILNSLKALNQLAPSMRDDVRYSILAGRGIEETFAEVAKLRETQLIGELAELREQLAASESRGQTELAKTLPRA